MAEVIGPSWPYPGENAYYPAGSTDPVRANAPYTPVAIVKSGDAPKLNLVGVLVLVGIVFLLEHYRRGR